MTKVPTSHPRYKSLLLRERLTDGLRAGIAGEAGLLAHGRGEAFDYLLGERTHDFAMEAIRMASALLVTANHPVISVNGSTASVAGPEIVELLGALDRLVAEVNIFYYSPERSRRIKRHLRELGATREILESNSSDSVQLPDIEHARKHMHPDGLARADVALVGLEDGDRCERLVASGRRVIAIDLNPLSRTAKTSHVTIVDEVSRALIELTACVRQDLAAAPSALAERMERYDNAVILDRAVAAIRNAF